MASKSNEIKTRTTNPIKSFTENSVRQNHIPYNVDRDKTENFSKQWKDENQNKLKMKRIDNVS